jgi:stress response protein YsnF
MSQSVVAVFENRAEAERAREEILASGVSPQCVSLHGSDSSSDMDQGRSAGTEPERETGIGHFFRSLFGMEDDRPARYEEAARRGHATLVVDCRDDEETDLVRTILDSYEVIDIDERAAQWSSEVQDRDAMREQTSATSATGRAMRDIGTEATIPVVEESIALGKREVEGGRVRVYTRVLERPVEESVQLREERARVERRPVDRPATEADMAAAFKEGSMEVTERTEVPVVQKQARVVEEVQIGKDVRQRTETVRDKIHKTDVQVEEEAPTAAEGEKLRNTDKPRRR